MTLKGGFHPDPDKRVLSTKEVARRLGIHYLTVMKYVKDGTIASVRYGRLYKIRLEEVERLERDGFDQKPNNQEIDSAP